MINLILYRTGSFVKSFSAKICFTTACFCSKPTIVISTSVPLVVIFTAEQVAIVLCSQFSLIKSPIIGLQSVDYCQVSQLLCMNELDQDQMKR